ncbi:protein hinderin [Protopterus annectens]|uniref:protein hinderin n=1 Tax=Protopterus annectens TaxID=7888 RepID=UPI001CFBC537|nr:protein hinderin [Protopterus annectens]
MTHVEREYHPCIQQLFAIYWGLKQTKYLTVFSKDIIGQMPHYAIWALVNETPLNKLIDVSQAVFAKWLAFSVKDFLSSDGYRVSEEKEETKEKLKAEQESFEKKIRQLEEQNMLIVKEREALQQQYRECQELLSLYQKYLSDQQEKLAHSLSEVGTVISNQKKAQNEFCSRSIQPEVQDSCNAVYDLKASKIKSPHQADVDGSYLGIVANQVFKNPSKAQIAGDMDQHFKPHLHVSAIPESPASNFFSCAQLIDGLCVENAFDRQKNSSVKVANPVERCHTDLFNDTNHGVNECQMQTHQIRQLPDYGQYKNAGDIRSGHRTGDLHKRNCGHFPNSDNSSIHPSGFMLNEALTATSPKSREMGHGKSLSEERRQKLLLQKMELEIERERLQQLLTQQEAKLLLKQKQLCQYKVDYSRYCEPDSFLCDAQAEYKGISTTRSNEKKHSGSGKKVEFAGDPKTDSIRYVPSCLERKTEASCRRDAATSPAVATDRKELVASATSPILLDSSRYEASLVDLVAALSPVSSRSRHHLHPSDHASHVQQRLSPRSVSHSKTSRRLIRRDFLGSESDDVEESRILEEIFFVC